MAPAATVAEGGSELSAPLAHAQSVAGTRLLIDVRSPAEWRQTGLPAKAHAITIHQPGGMNAFLASIDKLTGGDKSKPIALICASGVRSAQAMRFLKANGYTNVRNVIEGMVGHGPFAEADKRGWLKRGLPTRPCAAC